MIVDLSEPGADEPRVAGGKASALAVLARAGLPVPPGFVVTTSAFEATLRALELEDALARACALTSGPRSAEQERALAEARERLREAPLLPELEEELARGLERLAAGSVAPLLLAVRSSAVAEDLAGASFAGQYETVLGVTGLDEVRDALRHCWASFLGARAQQYVERLGPLSADGEQLAGELPVAGAVLVQRLIDADLAGVAFSIDPVVAPAEGASESVVINASYGLGHAVVGGLVTPDCYRVERATGRLIERQLGTKALRTRPVPGGTEETPVPLADRERHCLDDDAAERVAALAERVEVLSHAPADIEWALDGQGLWLLQGRPITTATTTTRARRAAPSALEEPALPPADWQPDLNTIIDPRYPLYSNGNISEVLPGCTTPLSWSLIGPALERGFRAPAEELGLAAPLGPGLLVLGFFYFRPYLNVSYFVEVAERMPGLSPDVILEEFVGPPETRTRGASLRDLLPHRLWRGLRAYRAGARRAQRLGRDLTELHALYEGDAARFAEHPSWSLEQLLDELDGARRGDAATVTHIWVSQFAVASFSALRGLTARWLEDASGSLAAELVTGLGTLPSADPAYGIHALATSVAASQELSALFARERDDARLALALADPTASQEICRFQAELARFLERFGHRAVCEAEYRNRAWREAPEQVLAHVRNLLGAGAPSPAAVQARQRAASRAAETRARARLSPLQRRLFDRTLRECRKRIAQREEMKNLLILFADRGRRLFRRLETLLVETRKLDQGDDLYFLTLDEALRLGRSALESDAARALIRRRRRDFAWAERVNVPRLQQGRPRFLAVSEAEDASRATVLTGLGVSPGVVEGRARVLLDPRRDSTLEPGEILVAPVTDLGWTPLFTSAAGLVVDVGGLLSHGSIVAREYGLPAVVGVRHGTTTIRTGDLLRLDGAAGRVTVLARAS